MEAQGISHTQHQQYGPPQHAFSSQLDMAQQPATGRPGAFNMNGMANALPQASMRHNPYAPGGQQQHQQQRYSPATSSPSMMSQMPQMAPQYPGQAAMPMGNPHYYMPQHPQIQHYYASQLSPTQQQARPNMGYYPNQMVMNHPQNSHIPQGYYYPPVGHYAQTQALQNPMVSAQYMGGNATHSDPRVMPQIPNGIDHSSAHVPSSHKSSDMGDGRSGIVRGPPRKPRQSGHAIWIGNLPPQTDLMHLVHHVCKEANGLESLFLISKSNCAFANFKDEQTCVTAQQKLHDSKFQSVRLVSRLRKSTVEGATGVTAPTGPAASSGSQTPHEVTTQPATTENATEIATPETNEVKPVTTAIETTPQKDKFFILKSLTVEDLELSVRTGIWATQSHNEETLNAAFHAVDNVYLVFSANKSGEYFGYARMTSQINEDPAAAIEFAPKAQSANDVDLPKAIPTEPTEFAPKGRIIDDSARGTIFWEAEREDGDSGDEEEEQEVDQSDVSSRKSGNQEVDGTKAWGKPFKLEWLSTARLPFYRTRGLRNPWNSNREVKIARDGTELEPSVGRRLIGLFNRVQSPGPGSVPAAMRPSMAMVAGYPPMRPQYQQ